MTGMNMDMTPNEIQAFLDGDAYFAIATLRKDGSPFVQPFGFLYETGAVYISVGGHRTIIDRLRRDPRVSLTVFNREFPVLAVIIEGSARQIADPGDDISHRIFRRESTWDPSIDLDAFERNWLAVGRTVFCIAPRRIISWDSRKKTDFVAQAGQTVTELRKLRATTD